MCVPAVYPVFAYMHLSVTHENLPPESESNRELGVRPLGRSSATSQGLRWSSATSLGLGQELSRVVWLLWDRGVHIYTTAYLDRDVNMNSRPVIS